MGALQQWLDTAQIDRENLRFQVRLLEQDDVAQQADALTADVERLEVENRSSMAVQSEHAQLQARLAEVERQLSAMNRNSTASQGKSGTQEQMAAAEEEDDEEMSQLRLENKLLEKRLDRMRKLSEQTRHSFLSAQVKSKTPPAKGSGASAEEMKIEDSKIDSELSSLLADNEAK